MSADVLSVDLKLALVSWRNERCRRETMIERKIGGKK